MIARPFASETVAARAVCRLKCSVVAKLIAAARRSPNTWASGTGMGPPDPVESGESFVGRVWSKHATASRSGLGAVLGSHHAGPHVEQSLLLREPDHLRHACQAPALGDCDSHRLGVGRTHSDAARKRRTVLVAPGGEDFVD